MNDRNYSALTKRLVLASIIVISAAILASSLRARPADNSETAQHAYKNVQILKDIPADDLVPSIQCIAASLGVGCDFCHVRDALETDDKAPKKVARQMIQMVLALNGQNFQAKRAVSCYTCHRGGRAPVSIPDVAGKVPSEPATPYFSEHLPEDFPTQPSEGLPPVTDILSKYLGAIGGGSPVEKVSTRIERGTVSFDSGPPFPVEVLTKVPDKQVFIVHMNSGDNITGFDGIKGWLSFPRSPVREMHHADLPGAKLDADLHFAADLQSTFRDFKAMQKTRIGDSESILVLASNQGQPPVELYFDANSSLLLREVRFAESPLGLNPTRLDYGDYKEFDGVKLPLHVLITSPNRQLDIKFDHVEQNVPLPDSKFEPQ